jgi:hypothetical protein
LDTYYLECGSDFKKFCASQEIEPQLHKLKAFSRLASPINKYPVFDAQFYLHFIEDGYRVKMNESEFTDAKWLSIPDALHLTAQN